MSVPATLHIATACAFATCAAAITLVVAIARRERAAPNAQTGFVSAVPFQALARRAITSNAHTPSLVVVGIDGYDELRRIHGAERSNLAVLAVGNLIQRVAGSRALVARLGDDEIAVLLTTVTAAEALFSAERIHRALYAMRDSREIAGLGMTASIGVASARGRFEDLLVGARGARRQAEQKGGNRTCSVREVGASKLRQSGVRAIGESARARYAGAA